jgi:hypothetical protein
MNTCNKVFLIILFIPFSFVNCATTSAGEKNRWESNTEWTQIYHDPELPSKQPQETVIDKLDLSLGIGLLLIGLITSGYGGNEIFNAQQSIDDAHHMFNKGEITAARFDNIRDDNEDRKIYGFISLGFGAGLTGGGIYLILRHIFSGDTKENVTSKVSGYPCTGGACFDSN